MGVAREIVGEVGGERGALVGEVVVGGAEGGEGCFVAGGEAWDDVTIVVAQRERA